MSTIDKQTLAFKELKGGLKDGDPQIKTCDAELAVLEASKNTLMGALVTNGVLPRSSGRRLAAFLLLLLLFLLLLSLSLSFYPAFPVAYLLTRIRLA